MVKINTVKSEKAHTKPARAGIGRLKTTEPTAHDRVTDTEDASLVFSPSVGQSRRAKLHATSVKTLHRPEPKNPVWVPVISSTGSSLMPCRPAYAGALVRSGRAKKRWFKGIFAIQMADRADGAVQPVACGIDPGSKREAMTIQSKQHTYLNVLSDAVTWVGDRIEVRRDMRRARRFRKTPCRAPRANRLCNSKRLPPSTKSRWQAKLRVINFLRKLYPITDYVVEDIKAKTCKGFRKWNKSFSPLEVGKAWFYDKVSKLGNLITKQGYETFEKRYLLGLKKTKEKMAETFDAHNVDSWVLSSFITGKSSIDNKKLFRMIPLQLHRRQLHYLKSEKFGIRRPYGGTRSLGLKRGSVVIHKKRGLVYIGGTKKINITLHDMVYGNRLTQNAYVKDCNFLYCSSWKTSSPFLKGA